MKIRTGDTVKVLSGKDRGKRGKVIRVLPAAGKVLVESMNMKKKHRRSRRQDRKGEVILIPHPIHASTVMLICPSCGKPNRPKFVGTDQGKKIRICRKCGKPIS